MKEEKRAKITLFSSSNLILPEELSTIEEVLKTLAAAVKQLETPGLDPSETLRLRSVIQGLKIYKEIFADYADYRGLEQRLIELGAKYDEFVKASKSHTSS